MTANGVLVLSGPPCSGKSSVGRVLAANSSSPEYQTIHIEVDSLFSLLLSGSDRNRDDRMLAYDAAHLLGRMLLERDKTVVLECTYARIEQRASLVNALAGLPTAPLWVVEFLVQPDDAVRRFQQRSEPTDLDDAEVRERVESFPYFDDALQLKTSASAPDRLAEQITEWLRSQPRSVNRNLWVEAGRGWGDAT